MDQSHLKLQSRLVNFFICKVHFLYSSLVSSSCFEQFVWIFMGLHYSLNVSVNSHVFYELKVLTIELSCYFKREMKIRGIFKLTS